MPKKNKAQLLTQNKRRLKQTAALALAKAKGTTRSQDAKKLRDVLLEAEQQQAATTFLRFIAGLEDPSAANALR